MGYSLRVAWSKDNRAEKRSLNAARRVRAEVRKQNYTMEFNINCTGADSLFENIKTTIYERASDLWRVDHEDHLQLKIEGAAPLVNSWSDSYFERKDDEFAINRNRRLVLMYVDLDPSSDPDNEVIARYMSEMIKLLVLYHRGGFYYDQN